MVASPEYYSVYNFFFLGWNILQIIYDYNIHNIIQRGNKFGFSCALKYNDGRFRGKIVIYCSRFKLYLARKDDTAEHIVHYDNNLIFQKTTFHSLFSLNYLNPYFPPKQRCLLANQHSCNDVNLNNQPLRVVEFEVLCC